MARLKKMLFSEIVRKNHHLRKIIGIKYSDPIDLKRICNHGTSNWYQPRPQNGYIGDVIRWHDHTKYWNSGLFRFHF